MKTEKILKKITKAWKNNEESKVEELLNKLINKESVPVEITDLFQLYHEYREAELESWKEILAEDFEKLLQSVYDGVSYPRPGPLWWL